MGSFFAITLILFLIFVSSRFIRYLADAASGRFSIEIVLSLLTYRLPGFLELILPLSLFLAIMLACGRLYVDSEMVVLNACGISKRRLLVYVQGAALTVAAMIALLSLWLTPLGAQKFEQIWEDPKTFTGLGVLVAGSFNVLSNSQQVVYVSTLNQNKTEFEDVFIAQTQGANFSVVRAHSGLVEKSSTNETLMTLQNGVLVRGALGENSFKYTYFDKFAQKITQKDDIYTVDHSMESLSTPNLMQQQGASAQSILHWRFALPWLACIAAIIALALSETSHRKGRYFKLLPGLILYVFYLSLLLVSKNSIAKGQLSVSSIWVVHGLFLILGLALLFGKDTYIWLKAKPSKQGLRQ